LDNQGVPIVSKAPETDLFRGLSTFLKLFALLLSIVGLLLIVGGANLFGIGGSPYYLLAGVGLTLSALLFWLRRQSGLWLLAFVVIGTLGWTIWETGFNIWAMLPRLDVVGITWIVALLPVVRRPLFPRRHHRSERVALAATTIALLALPIAGIALTRQSVEGRQAPADDIAAVGTGDDWKYYGGTEGGQRFSDLTEISASNVNDLKVAWRFHFNNSEPYGLQVTPLKVGNLVYVCDSVNQVAALDAETGRPRWTFDPKSDVSNSPFRACRGVAYLHVANATDCAERIFLTTLDARLIALDALSGRRCASFGRDGEISLFEGLGHPLKGYYSFNAAPTVARGKVIVGGTIADNQMWGEPSGVIRAFDAATGALSWAYDVGRPERIGGPAPGQTYTPATPNNWAQMAYDDSLGLLYVPTGNATPDYYGGRRRAIDDDISSSVLALDVETGRRRWRFQTVHHDVWDYDLGAQPLLIDLPGQHGPQKALMQATKRGELFLLDRTSGQPIAKVDERPVPQRGHAEGERLSATQPFSTGLPSLAGPPLTEASMWGLTAFDQLVCRIRYRTARYDGPMTPPGLQPSIQYPGYLGGIDWGSASVDPRSGIMVAVTDYIANYVRLVPRAEANAKGAWALDFGRTGINSMIGINAQKGTPFGVETKTFLSPLRVPCQQPPWSRLNAVDLRSGRVLWSRPLGTGKDSGPLGYRSHVAIQMGVPALGGVLVTRSNLSFVAASTDHTIRAFDTRTGTLVWEAPLPESGNATPMTYRSAASGRQFVVIAAAGHKGLGTHSGDEIVAFAIPH
jgi:quinoprotein glucose dehydrogenase